MYVVEDERDELHHFLFFGRALSPRRGRHRAATAIPHFAITPAIAQQGEEIPFEDEAQHQEEKEAANPDAPAETSATKTAATTLAATVFDVSARLRVLFIPAHANGLARSASSRFYEGVGLSMARR